VATKFDLQLWLLDALKSLGGSGTVAQVCKSIWESHQQELMGSENLLYTWQYDVRWAALALRKDGKLAPIGKRGSPWRLPDH
jgi:hypothetical protein